MKRKSCDIPVGKFEGKNILWPMLRWEVEFVLELHLSGLV